MGDNGEVTYPGAADLMRSLGLSVDGPARWGTPVTSQAAGLFVIELPSAPETAPLDGNAIRRWLERVPTLSLDGTRPTVAQLSRALHNQWQAGQPVLYVGRSAKSIGARLAGMYATALGDAKPNGNGHWLKTLANPGEMRVWWSETPAHEEYEDALLEALGPRPWANHAFEGSLRTDLLPRPTTRPTKAAPKARKPVQRKLVDKIVAPPKTAAAVLSREGHERLSAELAELRTVTRPQIIARVKSARELGDLKENGDYEYARKEQSFVEGRIQALEQLLRTGTVLEDGASDIDADKVRLGSTVEVEHDGERMKYMIVNTAEADPARGRLSNSSPVGRALLGASAGDEVVIQSPGGAVGYRVIKVR
ncbi:MAG: transcription elongation factor GreA [Chloroflexota bacterium]